MLIPSRYCGARLPKPLKPSTVKSKKVSKLYTPGRLRVTPYMSPKLSEKQVAFLQYTCRDVFYGGAAGGAKSWALLNAALQYADVPGYKALILRRTFPMLEQPKGLIEASHNLLDGKADYIASKHRWVFPSIGKKIELVFGHIEHEKDLLIYQGGGYHFIGMDEITQFTDTMIRFMHSRIRRDMDEIGIPMRFRCTGNPGGPGHVETKERYIDPETRTPGSVAVRAKLEDNPFIDQDDYDISLRNMKPLEYERLRNGNWEMSEAGTFFKRTMFVVVDAMPAGITQSVRAWDMAASVPKPGKDPDWTVGTRMDALPNAEYIISDQLAIQEHPHETNALMKQTAMIDGKGVKIREEQEGGSAGPTVMDFRGRELDGFDYEGKSTSGKAQQERVGPFASASKAGRIKLFKGLWNKPFLDEWKSVV